MAEPESSEFNPTGVWLDHFLGTEQPPLELFREFARGGGSGIILNGGDVLSDLTTTAVEMVHELGLQAMVRVHQSDLPYAGINKAGQEPPGYAIEAADAVLITLENDAISDAETDDPRQTIQESALFSVDPVELSEQFPNKPWLLLASPQTEIPMDLGGVFPGPLMGVMLGNPGPTETRDTPFPSAQEARDSLAEWAVIQLRLTPDFYVVPSTTAPQIGGAVALLEIANAVQDEGVRALVLEPLQYNEPQKLRDAVESLKGFPDDLPYPDDGAIFTINSRHGQVNSVALTPDGLRLVSGGDDGAIRAWDLVTGTELTTTTAMDHEGSLVLSVAVTPDGRHTVSGDYDGSVRLWDIDTGAEAWAEAGTGDLMWSVAVSDDGRYIVSGGEDGIVTVRNLATGAKKMSLPGHKRSALSVAITPDGRRIVSGGADGTFRIWDLETGEELWTLQADQLAVRSVAVAPDGSPHAVSAGQNESIRVWNIERGAEEGSPGESAIWHGR